jgi:hypothetical protein
VSGIRNWYDRPVLAPLLYGVSFFVTGSLGYVFGYLVTQRVRGGLYVVIFLYALLVLYLRESYRTGRRGEDERHDV